MSIPVNPTYRNRSFDHAHDDRAYSLSLLVFRGWHKEQAKTLASTSQETSMEATTQKQQQQDWMRQLLRKECNALKSPEADSEGVRRTKNSDL